MSRDINDFYKINVDGIIQVKVDIPFNESMIKKKVVQAYKEYIECPCGNEMKFENMLNHVNIYECPVCKKTTAIFYNHLNNLREM